MLPLEDKRLAKQFQGHLQEEGHRGAAEDQGRRHRRVRHRLTSPPTSRAASRSPPRRCWCRSAASRTPRTSGSRPWASRPTRRGYIVVNDKLETSVAERLRHRRRQRRHPAGPRGLVRRPDRGRELPGRRRRARPQGGAQLHLHAARDRQHRPERGPGARRGLRAHHRARSAWARRARRMAIGEAVGYIQIVADKSTDKIIGANMMGPHVTDLIHEIAVAITQRPDRQGRRRHHPRPPHHRRKR